MYFLSYLARPRKAPTGPDDDAGAYVNCWIDNRTRQAAEEQALRLIHDAGWRVEQLLECSQVHSEDYAADDPGLVYFEQAQVHQGVLVFDTWPLSGEKGE